jgi:hypothetical protein
MSEVNNSTPDAPVTPSQDLSADYLDRQLRALSEILEARGLDAKLVTYPVKGVKGDHFGALMATNPAAPQRGTVHVGSDGCVIWEYSGSLDAAGIGKIADEATNALRGTGMRVRPS